MCAALSQQVCDRFDIAVLIAIKLAVTIYLY